MTPPSAGQLAASLTQFKEGFVGSLSKEALERLEVVNANFDKRYTPTPPALGTIAPSFELPNASGKAINLSKILKNHKAVVLSWYRGGWCPYCNLSLRALTQANDEIESLGAKLICISPEIPDESLSTMEKNNLKFEVLSDEGLLVSEKYGIVFELGEIAELYASFGINMDEKNGNDGKRKPRLPVPATFVLDKEGKIVYSFVDPDYTKRAEPSDIIKAIKSVVA